MLQVTQLAKGGLGRLELFLAPVAPGASLFLPQLRIVSQDEMLFTAD